MGAVNRTGGACERRRSASTDTRIRRLTRPGPSRKGAVHRYYDPATEQFLSVDPLANETGAPYAYTTGDPVNENDPSGLISAGSICGEYGSESSQCEAAQQNSKQVVRQDIAGDAVANNSVIDVAGAVANLVKRNVHTIVAVGKVVVKGVVGCFKFVGIGAVAGGGIGLAFGVGPEGAIGGAIVGCAFGAVANNLAPPGSNLPYSASNSQWSSLVQLAAYETNRGVQCQ